MAAGWLFAIMTIGISELITKLTPSSWRPDKTPVTPDTTLVRVWSGMSPNDDTLAGHLPGVVLYDDLGHIWGQTYSSSTTIPAGNFRDYEIHPDKKANNVRATYIQLNACKYHLYQTLPGGELTSEGDWNGICIAGIEITWPDSSGAMIFGDVPFHMCGWKGYPSITDFPLPGGGSSGYHPFCIWLDSDDTLGEGTPKSIHFHIPDFDGQNDTLVAYNSNRDLLYKSQGRMGQDKEIPPGIPFFKTPLIYNPEELDYDGNKVDQTHLDPKFVLDEHVGVWPRTHKSKSATRRRNIKSPQSRKRDNATQNTSWVASKSSEDLLSVEFVCSQPNVVGPHYANLHDGKFCNMNDRTVWDICSGKVTSGCFDMDNQRLTKPFASSGTVQHGTSDASSTGSDSVILQLNTRIDMTGDS